MTTDRRTLIIDGDVTGANKALDDLDHRVDRVAASADRLPGAMRELDAEARRAGRGVGSIDSGVGSVAGKVPGLAFGFNEVVEAVEKVVAGIQAADAAMQRVLTERTVGNNLAFSIDAAREATHGLVSDMELMRAAIAAKRLGLADTEESFAKVAAAATALGVSSGTTANEGLAAVVEGLGRGSTEMLDNVGVTIRAADAQREYAAQLGISVSALTEAQKAEAIKVIGSQRVIETAQGVNLTLNESEQAWVRARQQYEKLSRETLPQATQGLTGVWEALAEGGEIAEDVLPGLIILVNAAAKGIQPLVAYVEFFARQMAAAGRVIETASYWLDRLGDFAADTGGRLQTWIADTEVGQWAIDAKDELQGMAGDGLDRLSDAIDEHIPWANELKGAWDEVRFAVMGASEASGKLGFEDAQAKIIAFMTTAKQSGKDLAATEAQRVADLREAAVQAEHQVKLAEAQKAPAAQLEQLYRDQHAAKLALLQATHDQAGVEKAIRDEEVRQAKTTSKGGGRGPTEADRVKAAGEIRVAYLRDALALQQAEADLWGTASQDAQRFAEIQHRIAIEALRVEQATLEVTRAKNSVERERNEARIEAIDREVEILEIQRDAAVERAQIEDKRAGLEQRIADLDREIERNEALGVSIKLLQQTRNDVAMELAMATGDRETIAQEEHEQELIRIEEMREQKIADAEHELVLFDERMALLEAQGIAVDEYGQARIDLEQRIAQAEGDTEALRQLNHKRELERKKTERKKQAENLAASRDMLGTSMAFADLALQHGIRNDAKRERAALRLKGVMAIATAALETVEGVAAIARYDFVGAAAHFAAATLGYVQGGIMLHGKVPSQGGGSGAAASMGGGGGGNGFNEEFQKNTQKTPSTPASAEELTRIRGGYGDQPAANGPGPQGGGTTINAGIIVSGNDGYLLDRVGSDDKRRWG